MKVSTLSFEFAKNLLIFSILFMTYSAAVNQLQFQGGNYIVSWNYSSSSQEIEFEVRVTTTGYVALGLSKINSGMQNLDIAVGGVNGGTRYLKDYYATGTGNPLEDQQQDTTLVSASESNGVTMVRWKRRLNTGDAANKDLQLQPGDPVYIAWAYHASSDNLQRHTNVNRGYSSQIVLVPAVTTTSSSSVPEPTSSGTTSPVLTSSTTTTVATTSTPSSSSSSSSSSSTASTSASASSSSSPSPSSSVTSSSPSSPSSTPSASSSRASTSTSTSSPSPTPSSTSTSTTTSPTTTATDSSQTSTTTSTGSLHTTTTTTTTTTTETATTSTNTNTRGIVAPTTSQGPSPAATVLPTTNPASIVYNKELSFKNGDYLVFWKFDSNTNELFFKLVVKATGWVGLGISNTNSHMKDLDVVIAGVSGGQGYIADYYSTSEQTPSRDTTEDYTLHAASESAQTTTVEFKRKINTGDDKDLRIVPGESYYLACAYHTSSDSLSYHSQRDYSPQKVVLAVAVTTTPTEGSSAATATYSVMLIILSFARTLIVHSTL